MEEPTRHTVTIDTMSLTTLKQTLPSLQKEFDELNLPSLTRRELLHTLVHQGNGSDDLHAYIDASIVDGLNSSVKVETKMNSSVVEPAVKPVVEPVLPVVEPVVEPVLPVVEPVLPVVPVVEPVVPVVEPVMPVVEPVVPVVEPVVAVVEPVAPVVEPVVTPVVAPVVTLPVELVAPPTSPEAIKKLLDLVEPRPEVPSPKQGFCCCQ